MTSSPHVRFINTAQSMCLDFANSSPSSRRPQWAMAILVGSTSTTGSPWLRASGATRRKVWPADSNVEERGSGEGYPIHSTRPSPL
ncbi:hypothetical protein WMF37_05915 [Sorangium sp. So ce291]|uniref:hypothetical protein n=1 Tax=Sorangium sp. So ce291 TaxID=3133294 RepID=UPI003F5F6855